MGADEHVRVPVQPVTESDEERVLLLAVVADPHDDDRRLVYADWLEEQGDTRADYLRSEVAYRRADPSDTETLRALEGRLRAGRWTADRAWLAAVARGPIENCRVEDCPSRWHALVPGDAPCERPCGRCDRTVHLCYAYQIAADH